MQVLIQRVLEASVTVNGQLITSIGAGYLIYIGVSKTDTSEHAVKMGEKIASIRLFPDNNGKMMFSICDENKPILMVSQFTLVANTSKGRRPDFTGAAAPNEAKHLIQICEKTLTEKGIHVTSGIFGANMNVSSINDGPINIIQKI